MKHVMLKKAGIVWIMLCRSLKEGEIIRDGLEHVGIGCNRLEYADIGYNKIG